MRTLSHQKMFFVSKLIWGVGVFYWRVESSSRIRVPALKLTHLRTANLLKVNAHSHPRRKSIFIPTNESSPNDLPFDEALITESPLRSLYWYHGTRLSRPLIRLVALFCTSKLVFQLFFFASHFHPDESVCVITILMRPIKVIMMSAVGERDTGGQRW